jgi:peroxin-10
MEINKFPTQEVVCRSIQKDNEYIDHMNHKILEIIDSLSYIIPIHIRSDKTQIIAKLIFFITSYLSHYKQQSPGEEYTKIKKDISFNNNIGDKKNILFYIISISIERFLLKYLYEKINNYIEKKVQNENHKYHKLLNKIFQNMWTFEAVYDRLEEIQFIYFFLNGGKYFDFIQKIFNLKYIYFNNNNEKHNPDTNNENPFSKHLINKTGFKIIGYLMLIKILFEIFILIKKIVKLYKELNNKNDIVNETLESNEDNKNKMNIKLKGKNINKNIVKNDDNTCLLCLDVRKETSSTVCGHLFCWNCIIHYLQTNPQCPFCRKQCLPQQVIHLQNYF